MGSSLFDFPFDIAKERHTEDSNRPSVDNVERPLMFLIFDLEINGISVSRGKNENQKYLKRRREVKWTQTDG